MNGVRTVLNKILDILNDSAAVLEEENGRVLLRIGSATEQVPVNYLRREDLMTHEYNKMSDHVNAAAATTTGQQPQTVKNKNKIISFASSIAATTSTTRQLRNSKTKTAVHELVISNTGKGGKVIKKQRGYKVSSTLRKKANNIENDTFTIKPANEGSSTTQKSTETTIERHKSSHISSQLKAKVVAVEGSVSSAFVTNPVQGPQIKISTMPRKRQRDQEDSDHDTIADLRQDYTTSITKKKRRY